MTQRGAARRQRRRQRAPHRVRALRSCPPASRTGWAGPDAVALLSSLLILLDTSVHGVGHGGLFVRADAGVAPDAQPLLVPAQPAAHIVRNADRTNWHRRRNGTADALRA